MGRRIGIGVLVGLALAGAGRGQDEGVSLEKQLERVLAGASQGAIPARLALDLADRALAGAQGEARYHFARAVALHHGLRFDEALAELAEASRLGMGDADEYLAGNPLGDWKRWTGNAGKLVPPLRTRFPDQAEYLVGLHYAGSPAVARVAEGLVPELVKRAGEVFGGVPARTAILVVESVPVADRIRSEANVPLEADSSGLRDDAGAFGSPYGCYLYEKFPDPAVARVLSEAGWRAMLAHEFAHGVAARRRAGLPISGGVDAWFEEGLATRFEQLVTGKSEAALRDEIVAAMKEAGGPPEVGLVKGVFQNVRARVNLNYLFAARMVGRLEATRGAGTLGRLSDAMTQPVDSDEVPDFDSVLTARAGTDEETLFAATEDALRKELGAAYPVAAPVEDPWTTRVTGSEGGAAVTKVLLDQAAAGGYTKFLFALEAPEAADDYGAHYEAGWGDPQEKGLDTAAPAGYWVYAEPYWIIWGSHQGDE